MVYRNQKIFNREEVTNLVLKGLGVTEMSKQLHCDYKTIKKYLTKEFPDYINKWKKYYFDSETFEKLCAIFCTTEEIAFFMRISPTKLRKRCEMYYNSSYDKIYLQYTSNAVISLRRKKYQLAEKGNLFALNSLLKNAEKKYLKYQSTTIIDYKEVLLEILRNENYTPTERLGAYDRLIKIQDEKKSKVEEVIFVNDIPKLPEPEKIQEMEEL